MTTLRGIGTNWKRHKYEELCAGQILKTEQFQLCLLFAFCFCSSFSSVHSSDDDGKPVVRKPSQTEGGQMVGKGGVVVSAVIVGLGGGQIVVAEGGGVIDERSDGGGNSGHLGDHVDR